MSTWWARCCSRARCWPRGCFVGLRITTAGSVHARKPRACHNRLWAGKGDGVPSAMRVSCTGPPEVSLSKRIRRRAVPSRTLLTVWSFFLPLSLACYSAGSWGRTMRRSVPSWAQGGRLAWRRVRRRRAQAPPPTSRRRRQRRPPRPRAAGRGPSGTGRGHRRGYAGPLAERAGGRGATDSLCSGPCRGSTPLDPRIEPRPLVPSRGAEAPRTPLGLGEQGLIRPTDTRFDIGTQFIIDRVGITRILNIGSDKPLMLTRNWLRVLGTAERSQVDQRIRQ